MSDDLESVLDSGNLDEIDAMLTKLDEGSSLDAVAGESGDTGSQAPADPPSQTVDVPDETVVLAKDGKHTIPFSVLEDERRQAAATRSQLEELNRRNALLEQQLTEANITPKQLPEQVRFTPEQLAELESYGEIGQAVAVLAQQNAVLMEQILGRQDVPPVAEPSNPFAANADTLRWAQHDSQWAIVESVNAALNADPAWAGKSLEQRVPEIVRRTRFALGEASDHAIDQAADAALQRAARVAPNSLTDVGGEVPGASKTTAEQLETADMQDVERLLSAQMAKGLSMDQALASLL